MEFKNLKEIEKFIKSTIKKHCFNDWKFEWFERKRVAGMCSPRVCLFNFSKPLFELNLFNSEFITTTILHEIAHAIDWERNKTCGHGPSWKQICVELGINSERLVNGNEINLPGKYIYKCPHCNYKLTRNKQYKTLKAACPRCCCEYNNGKFSKEFELILEVK